jgi:hypothetical protein
MSYKYTVLQDKPTSFYLLDEVRSGSVGSYTSLTSTFATYADLRDRGVSYSALSGFPVYDYSGNAYDGYAINASSSELMPLIAGGVRGTKILSDTLINFNVPGIANSYYADNSFSIEAWVVLPEYSSSEISIVADATNSIGLFYKNGNLIFKVGTHSAEYKISNTESLYVVGQFSTNKISLYINGSLVNFTSLDKYRFNNASVSFQAGPSINNFIIDCVAFYKFNLSDFQMLKHYKNGIKEIKYSQIVNNDGGYLFSMNTSMMKPAMSYSYPKSKSWKNFINENIKLSVDEAYLYFDSSLSGNFTFTDSIIIPSTLGITSSQIYWDSDADGISVKASIDGTTWTNCVNGSPLPFFNKNDNQIASVLYLQVTMSSSDTSKYLPILKSITLDFFKNKDFYCDNFGYYISSDYDYALPKYNSTILSYNKNNGLKMHNGHGFTINSDLSTWAIELIFTPNGTENVLFSAPSKIYEWNNAGIINKSGVSSVYVNGIDRTSATNISEFFSIGLPHYIVITLSTATTTNLKFNQNQTDSKSGGNNMYNNLSIYPTIFTQYDVARHYQLYTDNIINTVSDSLITISESTSGTNSTAYLVISVEPEAISI